MIKFYYNTETKEYPIYEADLLWIGEGYNSVNIPPNVVEVIIEEYEQDPNNIKIVSIGKPYKLEDETWIADWEVQDVPAKTNEQLLEEAEILRQLHIELGIIEAGE